MSPTPELRRATLRMAPRVEYRDRRGSDYPYAAVSGYAAVFYAAGDPGTEYPLDEDGRVVERLAPGCFAEALRSGEIVGLFNHDVNYPLGRVSAGTLTLSTDGKGLRYRICLPDSPVGRTCGEAVRRGDVYGSSFSFIPTKARWINQGRGQPTIREIQSCRVFDVGPVVWPAYTSTTAGMDSRDPTHGDSIHDQLSRPRPGVPRSSGRVSRDLAIATARLVELGLPLTRSR